MCVYTFTYLYKILRNVISLSTFLSKIYDDEHPVSYIIVVFYLIYCFVLNPREKIEFLSEHQIILDDITLQN